MAERRLHLILPVLFLLLAGQLGIMLALTVPVGAVADEHAHALKADSLLHGEIQGHRKLMRVLGGSWRMQQVVDGDAGLQEVSGDPSPRPYTSARWAALEAQPWLGPTAFSFGTIASYWPVFYLPAAAAFETAKIAGLRPLHAFHYARLADLAVFLALGTAALLVARRGQMLLFCTLAMPMSVSLGASLNQDGLIIASSALAMALLTRPTTAIGLASIWRDTPRLLAAALIGSIALTKPPYLPLAGMLLLPLPAWKLRRVWGERVGLGLIVTAATLAWAWLTVRNVATPVYWGQAEAGPLWPGPRPAMFPGTDMAAQLQVLMAKPSRFLKLPWRSLRSTPYIWDEAIGALGSLDVWLPRWLYRLWTGALAAAVLGDLIWRRPDAAMLPRRQAAWPLLLIVVIWLGIYLSQYLTWSRVGAELVDGPQGRYFLPLLPVLALALPGLGNLPRLRVALTALPVAACVAGAAILPSILVRFYYLH